MSQVIMAEYGRAKTVNFDLYEVDGVDFRVDAVDAGADCSIMKDEGAEGTCANDFVDEGQSYSLVLTAAEMQAARATLLIVDSATKVWLDKHIYIETYGHPSSAHQWLSKYWTNGAVNDGSASSTVWTFDGFTEATADHVIGSELTFTSGANAGQCRTVTDYTSTVITVSPAFLAAPADHCRLRNRRAHEPQLLGPRGNLNLDDRFPLQIRIAVRVQTPSTLRRVNHLAGYPV